MTPERKNIEAALRGYVLFRVNGIMFFLYSMALRQRKATLGNVEFTGLHIFKGWRTFFIRTGDTA